MTTLGLVFCFAILAVAAWAVWEQHQERTTRQSGSGATQAALATVEDLRQAHARLEGEVQSTLGMTGERSQYFEAQYQSLGQQVAQIAHTQSQIAQRLEAVAGGYERVAHDLQGLGRVVEEGHERNGQFPSKLEGLRASFEETSQRAARAEQGVAHLHERLTAFDAQHATTSTPTRDEVDQWLAEARGMLNELGSRVQQNTAALEGMTQLERRFEELEAAARAQASSKSKSAPERTRRQDVKLIRGIGPMIEEALNSAGIRCLEDIADWDEDDIEAFCEKLPALRERLKRDRWVEQARELAG